MAVDEDHVQGIMSRPVIHVAPHATVAQTLRTMIDHDIGAVVVVDGASVVGVFTGRDLTRRLLDDGDLRDREVGDVMSTQPAISGVRPFGRGSDPRVSGLR